MKFLVPKFYNSFICIGSKCEDTCCKVWQVNIEKKIYKKYRNYKGDKKLKELFRTNIKRKNNFSDFDYANIVMDNKGYCPFLNESKLCSLYIDLGEEYMSRICKTYPRTYGNTIDFIEKGLVTSCPEVVRLGLLNENKMEFDILELNEKIVLNELNINDFNKKEQELFWILRNFSIDLIQNRNYDLDERMIILSVVLNDLDKMIKIKKYNEIDSKISFYKKLIDNKEFKNIIKEFEVNRIFQMDFMKKCFKAMYEHNQMSDIYEDINEKIKNIFKEESYDENEILLVYENLYKNYNEKFIKNKSHILENYLVNNMFNSKFPYSKIFSTDIFNNLVVLIIRYLLLKFNFIIASNENTENLNEERIVAIISKLSRMMEHNPSMIKNIILLLEKQNIKELSYIITLVKD